MGEDGGKEKYVRNRLEKTHFRMLGARERQNWPVATVTTALDSKPGSKFAFANLLVSVRV